jgi:hypothetical protein
VIGVCAVGYAGARGLRHERNVALRFSERIEAAEAPGEPVLVHNRLAAIALRWTASASLKRQLVAMHGPTLPDSITGSGEFIVVASPGDVLLRRLHEQGLRLIPAITGIAGADATIPGGARIYFAVPPKSPPRPLSLKP